MRLLYHFGRYIQFLGTLFHKPEKFGMYWKEVFRQMNNIGVGSVTIVAIVNFFMGAVTAVQFSYQLSDSFVPIYYVGYIVRDMMIIEMAPTFSCIILAGKVGGNIATELGSMRISEQIDALEIMGVNTSTYLSLTKILAAILIVPFLVVVAAFVGVMGGWIATVVSGVPMEIYEKGLLSWFESFNVVVMLIKAFVFAFIFSSISCYQGFYVKGGALEIGDASTRSVVYSSIMIIVADLVIAVILLS